MKTIAGILSLFLLLSIASAYVNVTILSLTPTRQYCRNGTQCMTLYQCLSNLSECISDNTILEFEPGNHTTAGLSRLVIIQNVQNVSLQGKDSTIECGEGVGFLLNAMNYLHISGLAFRDCGAELSGNVVNFLSPSQNRRTFQGAKSSVIIANSYDVSLNSVQIINSYGYGLFAVNLLGQSGIYNSIISRSNFRSIHKYEQNFGRCNNPDYLDCSGGGLVAIYDECVRCSNGRHELVVSRVLIEHNINLQQWEVFGNTEAAGGLTISLWQSSYYSVQITVKDSLLDSNVGFYAGNSAMNFQHGSDFNIQFLNTSFLKGNSEIQYFKDRSKAGAMNCHWQQGYPSHEVGYSKILSIDNCTFADNSAVEGGALYIISIVDDEVLRSTVLKMNINNTNIIQNEGYVAIVFAQEQNTGESSVPTNSLLITIKNTKIQDNFPLQYVSESVFHNTPSNSCLLINLLQELMLVNLDITRNQMRGLHAIAVTSFSFVGTNYIRNNVADNGGGMKLRRSSFLMQHHSYVYIEGNRASMHGGGIFIDEDSNSRSNKCFFNLVNVTEVLEPQIILRHNNADLSGHSIYGGRIDSCQFEDALSTGYDAFNQSFEIPYNRSLTEITSSIYQICFCIDGRPKCDIKSQKFTVYPGQSFSTPAAAVGQLDGTTVDTAISYIVNSTDRSSIRLGSQQKAQSLHTNCTSLNYSLSSGENNVGVIGVQTNYGRTRLPNSILLLIEVHTAACPLGFTLKNQSMTCDCNMFLLEYSAICFIDEPFNNIQRNPPFWIGYDSDRSLLLAHNFCPFSYCIAGEVKLNLVNGTSSQCQLGRSGILCGQCQEGLSVVFGSQACKECSNSYISLSLVFLMAGLVLVGVMTFGNLTISEGRFNGLIFYANILRVHHSVFFPSNHVNVITIFIAWLNLDLGIETCFYDGMDAYGRTWLQYVFPAYVWILAGIIIILAYYSKYAAKVFGTNAIQVLATLFLLSYTKVQRIVLDTWSSTLVRHENGSFAVWLVDGNVPFLNQKHTILSLMSIAAILLFICPFTLILLCEYPLQAKFGTAMLKYKLTPFIHAYQGPYKTKFRWWTGAMLIVRSVLLTAFGVNVRGDPNFNLEIILSLCVIMLGFLWNMGTIYKDNFVNAIESFFIVNLGLLSGWTVFNRYATPRHLIYQQAITYTLVGASFAVFVSIIFHQIFITMRKKLAKRIPQLEERPLHQSPEPESSNTREMKCSETTLTRETLIIDGDRNQ